MSSYFLEKAADYAVGSYCANSPDVPVRSGTKESRVSSGSLPTIHIPCELQVGCSPVVIWRRLPRGIDAGNKPLTGRNLGAPAGV